MKETLAGKIVLTIHVNMKSDDEAYGHLPQDQYDQIKRSLDELHLRKIELADEIFVINVDGYIGSSTAGEIRHAMSLGRSIRYLEEPREAGGENPSEDSGEAGG